MEKWDIIEIYENNLAIISYFKCTGIAKNKKMRKILRAFLYSKNFLCIFSNWSFLSCKDHSITNLLMFEHALSIHQLAVFIDNKSNLCL